MNPISEADGIFSGSNERDDIVDDVVELSRGSNLEEEGILYGLNERDDIVDDVVELSRGSNLEGEGTNGDENRGAGEENNDDIAGENCDEA